MAAGGEEPGSPAQTDFTDAQLKPAPLRLTRKSNSSGGQSDNSLFRGNSSATSGRTPNSTKRNNGESLNTIMHRAATPSTYRTAPNQTSPKLASLVSKFEILDVMGTSDARALQLPSPDKGQRPPAVPTPTPDDAELQHATPRQGHHLIEKQSSQKHVNISLPRSSQAHRGARSKEVASDVKVPITNGPQHWDPSNVAARRKLFESGSTVPRPFDSPIATPVVTRTVARVPSQGEQRRESEIVNPDQPFTVSARRPVAAKVSAPVLSSQQSATDGVKPERERRKSVAALRMSFEHSSLPDLRPETPSSTQRRFRRTLTQGLSTATEVPTPMTPRRESKDPITPTRVKTLRSSEDFAQTNPHPGQAANQPIHRVDNNASSSLKQTQLHSTASRLVGSHDGNVSDAVVDSRRPVNRKNSDTPTRTSAHTSTRRPSSQHHLLLSRTLSVKVTTGPQTTVTLQQPWASHSASGPLPLTTSHSHGHLDQSKPKSGSSSETSTSAPLAPANRVKDLQRVFDNNPAGPGSAPFLPFIQKRRAQTLTLGVPMKANPSAPIMVSTTVAVTTRKASRRSYQQQQQQQQQQSSDVIPETASSTASSVVRTRKRSKTLPSSLGGYRRKTSGPAAGTGLTSYFQRRKIKKQQKQDMKRIATGEDSPVKERISLFEQLGGGGGGGGPTHGHSKNGRNGCGSIVSLPLSMHSKRKSSETDSSSQSLNDGSSRDTHLAAFSRKGHGSSSSGSRVVRVLSFGTSRNRDNGNRGSRNGKALRAAGRKISNAVSMSMSMSKRKDSGGAGTSGGEGKGKGKLKSSNGSKAQPLVMSSTNKETGESTFFVKGVLWKVSGSHGDLDLNVAVADGQSSPEGEKRKRGESTTETITTSFPSTRVSASGSGSGSSGSAGAIARHPVLQQWPHLDKVNQTVPHRHDSKHHGSMSLEDGSLAPEWSRDQEDDDPFLQPTQPPAVVRGSSSKITKSATAPTDVGSIMSRKRGLIPTRRSHGDVVEAARAPSTSLRKSFTMAVLPRLSSGNSSNDDYSQDGDRKSNGNKLTKQKGKEARTTSFPPSFIDQVQSRRQWSISWGQRAAAAAFGIGQRLKERKGSGRSSSLLGKGSVETGSGAGTASAGNSNAHSDVAVPTATTAAATLPIPNRTITTESLRHDE
ncbi:hypothetical protein NEUTE1DRAFT_112333 [Neurospora tetrasperma FGSC 2508]|uniref:Uncharacterized protein n=1 Tax=Neurospora tetrasperma (strain FGSC 2508 / ATCC MYA-4615 / P0657) TaxID=510951 RepID=F8MS61_NEUT8|nr:uncharacterized protein NEUTE1DRAFT_112333 [Neurospora tetrasperma FGSC 2508]EGO55855.1 hypothetical protein NEUTE1DRAFT_112333 [Neurospora tetrasperma FGSC 2508]EGZ68888.1 hypothetical protein NEUTE2DRAFT_131298 [Neurospora tetrasperma FGSC 2509]